MAGHVHHGGGGREASSWRRRSLHTRTALETARLVDNADRASQDATLPGSYTYICIHRVHTYKQTRCPKNKTKQRHIHNSTRKDESHGLRPTIVNTDGRHTDSCACPANGRVQHPERSGAGSRRAESAELSGSTALAGFQQVRCERVHRIRGRRCEDARSSDRTCGWLAAVPPCVPLLLSFAPALEALTHARLSASASRKKRLLCRIDGAEMREARARPAVGPSVATADRSGVCRRRADRPEPATRPTRGRGGGRRAGRSTERTPPRTAARMPVSLALRGQPTSRPLPTSGHSAFPPPLPLLAPPQSRPSYHLSIYQTRCHCLLDPSAYVLLLAAAASSPSVRLHILPFSFFLPHTPRVPSRKYLHALSDPSVILCNPPPPHLQTLRADISRAPFSLSFPFERPGTVLCSLPYPPPPTTVTTVPAR